MSEQIDNNSIHWIEEAIVKEYFKYYDYQHFNNVKEIGTGAFGKVYRANWKNSAQYLALKSFPNFNRNTAKEIVRELKLQRDVDFHNNIIRFYGITSENKNSSKVNYSLVMEYADGGTLRQYLKKNFKDLNWDNKLSFAYQLACAVSCLHSEKIVHSDLHPGNVLIVNRTTIKLADFGLSKKIEDASKLQSKLFGIIPFVDPKNFHRQKDSDGKKKVYSLNKKSDVYSVGVLLWEISSGQAPFCNDIPYDLSLAFEISNGLRETPIPDTPVDYFKLYTECWDNDPDNRPNISEVIDRLKPMMSADNLDNSENLVHEKISGIDEEISNSSNLAWVTDELKKVLRSVDKKSEENPLSKPLNKFIDKTVSIIDRNLTEENLNLVNNIGNFILNNRNLQSSSTSGTDASQQSSVEEVSDSNSSSSDKYNRAFMYRDGIGVDKNEIEAFQLFKESAEEGHLNGMNMLGECYYDGKGIDRDRQKAFELFQKAADLGNNAAKYNLGRMYLDGDTVEKDEDKARELFKSSAEGVNLLASSHSGGNSQESEVEFYRRIARLGTKVGQIDLNRVTEKYKQGEGIIQVIKHLFDNKI